MVTVTAFEQLIAIVVPILVAFFTTQNTASWVKGLAALVLSVLFGIIHTYLAGDVKPEDFVATIGIIIASAQAHYSMWLKPLGVTGFLQKLPPVTNNA